MAASEQNGTKVVSYKDTLNLPRTDFPIRAQAAIDDPALIERWQKENLYHTSFEHNKGKEKFILHDGPPYANGPIHLGHAYNKILKDIIGKAHRMMGKQAPITPGWDCHGLPIELKVSQENPGVAPEVLKKKCREYAQHWIDVQKEEFKRLGVLMDWARPYLTMEYGYEGSILEVFGYFVAHGYIERKNKTVPWCFSCKTVLATAEIEYHERKDPSLYVEFSLEKETVEKLFSKVAGHKVSLLVWTTTPWTLPLNRAVMIHPEAPYAVIDLNNGNYGIVGAQLVDKICAMLNIPKQVVMTVSAKELLENKIKVHHPFIDNFTVPVVASDSVGLDEGTACVHCAPGCGPEDYDVGIRNKLEIFSPISPDGLYTKGIVPKELEGMPVTDGQIWVIKKLAERGNLLYKTSIRHSYPHCWRCHHGLIFRATKQWFCDLSREGLKNRTLEAIDTKIKTFPENSVNRLRATVEGRLEWCLSRQRVWGVPIPALICTQCDYTHITPELVDQVAKQVKKEGIEYWDTVPVSDLLPKNFSCPTCESTSFIKEHDILDVWFDSGVSHYAVLRKNPELAFPADVYVEGKDQHRGWFQSSLLTAMVIEKQPPMKTIVTHGYTVDEQGRKMSKSLGNGVAPQEMINQLGTDGLRLWVSTIDASSDVVVSNMLLDNVKEVFRKVRNTCRFLLSNLYDFNGENDALPLDKLLLIDRAALQELYEVNAQVIDAYNTYDLTAVFHALADYCSVNLSAYYLDIVKDRLYVEKADGHLRRSAQTACYYILDTLTKLMAPILSFTAEQVSDLYQKNKKHSIHLQSFVQVQPVWHIMTKGEPQAVAQPKERALSLVHEQAWLTLKNMRSAILKALEGLREQGIIKHSLEARVTLYWNDSLKNHAAIKAVLDELKHTGQSEKAFFEEYCIVSQVEIAHGADGLMESELPGFFVKAEKARGQKCPRCWRWEESLHEHLLCSRCAGIVK